MQFYLTEWNNTESYITPKDTEAKFFSKLPEYKYDFKTANEAKEYVKNIGGEIEYYCYP